MINLLRRDLDGIRVISKSEVLNKSALATVMLQSPSDCGSYWCDS